MKDMDSHDLHASDAPPPGLREQAEQWLLLLLSGKASERNAAEFRKWRDASPAHAQAFADVQRLWKALGPAAQKVEERQAPSGLAMDAAGSSFAVANASGRGRRHRQARRAFLGGAVAATAACLAVKPPWGMWPGVADIAADYHTRIGEQRRLEFAGVAVEMNTQTSLNRHAFSNGGEGMALLAGEAQFVVEDKRASPFAVLAGGVTVIPGDAACVNIRLTDDDAQVTCVRGSVKLESSGRSSVLHASQQARLEAGRILGVIGVDADAVSAWQRRLLIFNNQPLSAVVAEINRYRPGRIILTDARLGKRTVQVRISLDQLDTFPDLVRDAYGAEVRSMPGGVILLG